MSKQTVLLSRAGTRMVLKLLALALLTQSAWAQTLPLEPFLQKLNRQGRFNGVVLLARDHKVVFEKAFGYQDIASRQPMKPDSCFNLASISKPITATAILMLYEQDVLDLDDDISEYLPELGYEGITIRHLLSHTSGLPDYIELVKEHWDPIKKLSNQDLLALLAAHGGELGFAPGSKYEYSNTGYALLASIVEAVTEEGFSDWLNANIFAPLQMKHSFVLTPDTVYKKTPCRVYAYSRETGTDRLLPDKLGPLDGIYGDGGIVASAGDLFRFDQALYDESLISEATRKEAFRSYRVKGTDIGYGLGWSIGEDNVYHGGSWEGFQHYFTRYHSEGNTIVILTSIDNDNLDEIHSEIEATLAED